MELPSGWDGEIYQRAETTGRGASTHPVLHAASFPLPPERGDFGGNAIELMRTGDVFFSLVEFDAESATTALFEAEGFPTLDLDDFDPRRIHQPVGSQSAAQYFFHVGPRAFCLYVVVGSHRLRARLVPLVAPVVATVAVG